MIMLTMNSYVRLIDPPKGEENGLYRVLEIRGDRALVEDTSSYFDNKAIRPTHVFQISDLEQMNHVLGWEGITSKKCHAVVRGPRGKGFVPLCGQSRVNLGLNAVKLSSPPKNACKKCLQGIQSP